MTDTSPTLDATAVRPLLGVRVVACAGTIGGGYVARLLTDLGADVVVVEPPGGSDLRHRGPYVERRVRTGEQRRRRLLPGRHALDRGRRR